MSERNRNQKRRDKKDVFYETEKASERMEDMHLFIQTALENRGFLYSWKLGIDGSTSAKGEDLVSRLERKKKPS